MNLQYWTPVFSGEPGARRVAGGESFFGQNVRAQLGLPKSYMPFSFARRAAISLCLGLFLGLPAVLFGQHNYYARKGTEYGIAGALPGDQVLADAAVTTTGGFLGWQDNITDGD